MSAAVSVQTQTAKPQALSTSKHAGMLLQRKCACGSPTSSLTGECAECKSKKRLQTKLTIGASNDPLEQEADRVADQVVAKRTVSSSVSPLAVGRLQREDAPKEKTKEEKYKEGLEKLSEAFLKTPLGKEILEKIKQDTLVRGATELGKDFISTWPGKIITGAAATGAVAALAATHNELPAQIPEIPLNVLTPGLSVQLSYKGPVDKPTEAMITFKFTEQAPKNSTDKKPMSEADKFRAETARLAAEDAKFRAGMTYMLGSPEDLQQKAEQEAVRKAALKYSGGLDIDATIKKYPWLATPQPKSGLQLTMPKPTFGIHPPSLIGDEFKLKSPVEQKKKQDEPTMQRKLAIGASNDPLEQEADWVAGQVLAAPAHSAVSSLPPRIQRYTGQAATDVGAAPASVGHVLFSPGRPLDPALQQDMEQRFGHDFSRVRIHSGEAAEQSAQDVNANAYTVGHHIVFGAGRYAPHSFSGRKLLAHELTHVVQQSASAAQTMQRATMRLGALTIHINYNGLPGVTSADMADRIVALATGLTGSAPDAAQDSTIRALPEPAQRWLMFGLDLLTDNSAAATGLDKAVAVQRLLNHAPGAVNTPLPDPDDLFVREVLRVSGWSEVALTGRLAAPSAAKRAAISTIVNPPPTSGSASDPLDDAALQSRLPPALEHLLKTIDPANWTNVGTRSISAFQRIGDVVQEEARAFFAPYADTAISNLFDLQPAWHASANIFDTGALVPDAALRQGYLRNRAEIVGRNTTLSSLFIDTNIFADVHFDPTRAADRTALASIVSTLIADPVIEAIVDRLIQHTGRQSGTGAGTTIGLVTEFNADTATACQDHWSGIDTLCHEVLHALVHPNFVAAAGRVSFPQVIREGFTEALGVQLFNDKIVPKAATDAIFKSSLEVGVSGAPCPAPAAATIGYGAAGSGAEAIRVKVGNDNFRAAYFLGRPELAGLPT